jgi:hypothetical protein
MAFYKNEIEKRELLLSISHHLAFLGHPVQSFVDSIIRDSIDLLDMLSTALEPLLQRQSAIHVRYRKGIQSTLLIHNHKKHKQRRTVLSIRNESS